MYYPPYTILRREVIPSGHMIPNEKIHGFYLVLTSQSCQREGLEINIYCTQQIHDTFIRFSCAFWFTCWEDRRSSARNVRRLNNFCGGGDCFCFFKQNTSIMPGLIGRLNCLSSKKSNKKRHNDNGGGSSCDDNGVRARKQLLVASPTSSTTTPTRTILAAARSDHIWFWCAESKKSNNPTRARDSIPTIDSDYNNIHSGNFSLSDAGGTVFSGSQQQSLSNFTHTAWPMSPMSPFGASSSLAGDSVERRQYTDYYGKVNNGRPSSHLIQSPQSRREEMLEICAPPGVLGVVIDTPRGGSPVVHAIKDTCPIRREICVGDKLVAVDDVDVRNMSAVDVSKLISKKSGQAKRKLTVIRSARGGDVMY
ncbi:hypothetical protein ACHAW5_006013 [Stephanodiscus triporus]|uniref:PDZ domain-containing protein n=1 Tax=Stephanodiscus triporus TaxID=2934178 RepID=A0ABD3PGL3_9STRA